MTHEQELVLLNRYPDLFDPDTLAWNRSTGFTLQLGAPGWFALIDAMCKRLSANGSCRVHELKEKVGELRVAYDGEHDDARRVIELAQQQSRMTCQLCGAYGQLRILPESVIATLCDSCESEVIRKLDTVP
jgi:hypothetical protein